MIKHHLIIFILLTQVVTANGPYRPPNLEKKIFDPGEIQIDLIAKAALFSGLISVARDFDFQKKSGQL